MSVPWSQEAPLQIKTAAPACLYGCRVDFHVSLSCWRSDTLTQAAKWTAPADGRRRHTGKTQAQTAILFVLLEPKHWYACYRALQPADKQSREPVDPAGFI